MGRPLMRQGAEFAASVGGALIVLGGGFMAMQSTLADDPSGEKRAVARGWRGAARGYFIAGVALLLIALVLFVVSI